MLKDMKKLTIFLLKKAENHVEKANEINTIGEILQPFTYLMDIIFTQEIQKIDKCLKYVETDDYLKMADLLNEGMQ